MKYVFVAEEHKEYGSMGWRQKSQPGYDPYGGMAVAHDILEHFPGGDESPTDELMAIGASFYVRGEEYFVQKGQRIVCPGENFADEIVDFTLKIWAGDLLPVRNCPFAHPRIDDHVKFQINRCIRKVKEGLIERNVEDRDTRCQKHLDMSDQVDIRRWIAHGYLKAVRRYRGHDRWRLMCLFCEIEKDADRLLKHAEVPGFELEVHVNLKKLESRCVLKEPGDEY